MKVLNFTPHDIVLNNGVVYESVGSARCSAEFSEFDENGVATVSYGKVNGLPEPVDGVVYIVSAMVLDALRGVRDDLVAPATGHPDCVRENGKVVSVPGFVKNK